MPTIAPAHRVLSGKNPQAAENLRRHLRRLHPRRGALKGVTVGNVRDVTPMAAHAAWRQTGNGRRLVEAIGPWTGAEEVAHGARRLSLFGGRLAGRPEKGSRAGGHSAGRCWIASRYRTIASSRCRTSASLSTSRVRLNASPHTGIVRSP
jgi:hypothetical protein